MTAQSESGAQRATWQTRCRTRPELGARAPAVDDRTARKLGALTRPGIGRFRSMRTHAIDAVHTEGVGR